MKRLPRLLVISCALTVLVALGARPAWAQDTPTGPPAPRITPHATFNMKHHISFMVSGGWDLDVIGDVTAQAVGSANGRTAVIQESAYPDIYYSLPTREEASLGYGLFAHTEILARYSRADYKSTLAELGVTNASMVIKMSDYKEQSWDFGLRHYFATGTRFREFMNLTYGRRTIQAISGMSTSADVGDLGEIRFYNKSRVPTIGLEFGLTIEIRHIGVFLEGGMRWQRRLSRIDDDLTLYGLDTANDTGSRLYMPLQVGLLFRL